MSNNWAQNITEILFSFQPSIKITKSALKHVYFKEAQEVCSSSVSAGALASSSEVNDRSKNHTGGKIGKLLENLNTDKLLKLFSTTDTKLCLVPTSKL